MVGLELILNGLKSCDKRILFRLLKCKKVVLQIELLRSNSRLGSLIILLGMVHTRSESLWNWLKDAQTCGITLALAFVLYHLSAI